MAAGEIAPGWRCADPDERAAPLAVALGVSRTFAQLLVNRGQTDAVRAQRYLRPRLADLRAPDGEEAMFGFRTAVERLVRAIADGERVGLFGDYDVDGVTSAALLARTLRRAG